MSSYFLKTVLVIIFLMSFLIISQHPSHALDIYWPCNQVANQVCVQKYNQDPSQSCSQAGLDNYSVIGGGLNNSCGNNAIVCCAPNYQAPQYSGGCTYQGGYCTSDNVTTCFNGYSPQSYQYPDCSSLSTCCLSTTCKDLNGFCAPFGHQCPNGYAFNGTQLDCYSDTQGGCCTPIVTPPACQSGPCGPWTGGQGANQCGNVTQTQTCNMDNPQICNAFQRQYSQSVFIDNCTNTAGYACTNGNTVCTTSITANVYTDYDHSGSKNGNDAGKQGVSVNDGGGAQSTNSSGTTVFTQDPMGNYTVTMTTPANFAVTKSTALTNTGGNNDTQASPSNLTKFNLGTNNGNEQVTYYVTPLYQISGNVFTDANKNKVFDPSCNNPNPSKCDQAYTGGGTITVTGGPTNVNPITVAGNGTWSTPNNLESGNYTVTYTTALPTGYSFTTNSAWTVTVGDPAGSPKCSVSTSKDGKCRGQNNGSIDSLNIGVTNENTHNQVACLDMRIDNNGGGTVADMFPAPGATCGGVNGSNAIISDATCSTGSGIVYSCNGTFDFGLGSPNANNWQAGGATQECYNPPGIDNIRTSYNFLLATAQQSGITPTDMSDPSVCGAGGIGDCTLDPNLPKGVYIANGNLTLNNATTLPAPADPNNDYSAYIFLVNGNLTINNNILVPQGSTALFSASGNIDVGSGVGQDASNTALASVNTPNLEGIYSADNSFTVHSLSESNGGQVCNADGSPIDSKLNIVGAVIDNAAQSGGQFVNNRDLCTSDLQCPSVSTGDGLNYLLTLVADGQFVLHKNFNWNEVKP